MTTKIQNNVKVVVGDTCKSACKCKGKSTCGKKKKKVRRMAPSVTPDVAPKRYMTNAVGGGNAMVRDNHVVVLGNREPNPEGNTRALQMYRETYDRALEYQQRNFELTLNAMRQPPPPEHVPWGDVQISEYATPTSSENSSDSSESVNNMSVSGSNSAESAASSVKSAKSSPELGKIMDIEDKEQAEHSNSRHRCHVPGCDKSYAERSGLSRHLKEKHSHPEIQEHKADKRKGKGKAAEQ